MRSDPDCHEIDYEYICADRHIEKDIAEIFTHPAYDYTSPNKLHDIAILRVDSFINFTEFIRPICLPTSSNLPNALGSATVTGFGMTETKNSSDRMLKAEIDIVSHNDCKRKYRLQGRSIVDSQICAIKYHTDTW